MAVLFSIANTTFPAGAILTHRSLVLPIGVNAVTYTVTIGDPAAKTPTAEDASVWVEFNDRSAWHELIRFVATCPGSSVGRIELRGTGFRISAICGQATIVSLSVETSV